MRRFAPQVNGYYFPEAKTEMKTLFLKNLDQNLGRVLTFLIPGPRHPGACRSISRILFIRPGGIGDAVLLIPAIQAVANMFPHSGIDILAESRNSEIFSLCPDVETICRYDHPAEFVSCLKKQYDVVIDTEQWHRLSSVVARLIRSNIKIGFGGNSRKKMFTKVVAYNQNTYEYFSFFQLLEPLGIMIPRIITTPFLKLPAETVKKADELLAYQESQKFIVIFPGASIPERRWGAEKFSRLCRQLNNSGLQVVILGGKEDKGAGDKIIQGNNGLNLAGKTNLAESAAILDRARLLISGDSGILHIAVSLDTPTISMFGPGITKKWAPQGNRHIVINKQLPCSPCTSFGYTSKCSKNGECLGQITVEEIFQLTNEHLMLLQ